MMRRLFDSVRRAIADKRIRCQNASIAAKRSTTSVAEYFWYSVDVVVSEVYYFLVS